MTGQFSRPECVLVDLDGTLALRGNRSPYDYSRVNEDEPNSPVVTVVLALRKYGLHVLVISGREDSCRDLSETWLKSTLGFTPVLLMRKSGDSRPDYVIKEELLTDHISDRYRVELVIDDRQQCVDLWRSLGLTTLQVADGDF